jgi:adenylate cyclase
VTETPSGPFGNGTWAKLSRRKVVQWGLAYMAGAWALLQGVDFLAEAFDWPNESRRISTLVLLIGLPIAIVIAWYHGDRGEQHVGRSELAILTVIFLLAGGALWWYGSRVAERVDTAEATRLPVYAVPVDARSVAVLPFVNLNADREQEYLSDGVSEEILDALARVPGLYVPARASSFQFKGRTQDPRIIAEQLRVANLLTGSVRRSGQQVRILAQLTRAADGVLLWSATFDSPIDDLMSVQQKAAQQVATTLEAVQVSGAEGIELEPQTSSASAYEMYLEGRYLLNTRKVANVHRALRLLREATLQDPTFAEAQAAFAIAIIISRDYPSDLSEGYIAITQAEQAATHALELNPELAEAHAALGMIAATRRDWREAEEKFREAVAAEPNNAMPNMWYGNFLRALGRVTDATPYFEKAWRLDPLAAVSLGNLATSYVSIGRQAEAEELLELADARGMRHPAISIAKIAVATPKGDQQTVEAALAEWFAYFPGWIPSGAESVLARAVFDPDSQPAARELLADLIQDERQLEGWGTLLVAALAGDLDTAFASADHSSPSGGISWGMAYWHPSLTSWRSDPRFKRVVEKLGMPPYWRVASWPDACKPVSASDFQCTG